MISPEDKEESVGITLEKEIVFDWVNETPGTMVYEIHTNLDRLIIFEEIAEEIAKFLHEFRQIVK